MTTNLVRPPVRTRATPNITPFTYYDGATYLEILEALRKWLRDVLVPEFDELAKYVDDEIEEALATVEDTLNAKIAEIDQMIADQNEHVDQEIVNLTAYVDDAVQQVINSAIELQDSVMAGIAEDESSEYRTWHDRQGDMVRSRAFGERQNQSLEKYVYPERIDFGAVEPAPPVAVPTVNRGIDVIAHWYNDYGLEHTASAPNAGNGSYTWYDWDWNFPTNTGDGDTSRGYDPQREPLQGFYQGDNADVLDWQAKWAAEAGVTAVSLVASNGANISTWNDPTNKHYWQYQLLNNSRAFKSLNWMLWLKHDTVNNYDGSRVPGDGTSPVEQQWDDVVEQYRLYDNGYTWTEDGKAYAVVFQWDGEQLRGHWDNYSGDTKTRASLARLADGFKAIGYDGVMVIARNATSGLVGNESLKASGVLYVRGEYSRAYSPDPGDYAVYANTAQFPTGYDVIPSVQTAFDTQYPHPGNQNRPGTTPELFRHALHRCVNSIVRHKQRRMVFINNMSEWAESGPGLIPNIQDGFGYLDAVRSIPAINAGGGSSATSATGGGSSLTVQLPDADVVEVILTARGTVAGDVTARFNGSSNNYHYQRTVSEGATVTASRSTGQSEFPVGKVSSGTTSPSLIRVVIYSADSRNKMAHANSVSGSTSITEDNVSATQGLTGRANTITFYAPEEFRSDTTASARAL